MTSKFCKTYSIWYNFLAVSSSLVLAVSKLLSKVQDGACAGSEGPLLYTGLSCSHARESMAPSLEIFLTSCCSTNMDLDLLVF